MERMVSELKALGFDFKEKIALKLDLKYIDETHIWGVYYKNKDKIRSVIVKDKYIRRMYHINDVLNHKELFVKADNQNKIKHLKELADRDDCPVCGELCFKMGDGSWGCGNCTYDGANICWNNKKEKTMIKKEYQRDKKNKHIHHYYSSFEE